MKNAAFLRNQIETSLGEKNLGALSPRARVEPVRIPSGIVEMDEQLGGGLPVGTLTEFVGQQCSGRTTSALAYLAAITKVGSVCAWIDISDALDPEAAAANGVDLERLLWVRCGPKHASPQATPETTPRTSALIAGSGPASSPRHTGGGSPHPRSEGRDMPNAIATMLQAHGGLYDKQLRREKKAIGTPGMPNRPLSQRSEHREEQINSDRLPPRRGENLAIIPRCSEPLPRREPHQHYGKRIPTSHPDAPDSNRRSVPTPWQALDQALRATDLLLQGGGFNAIVLDLGGIPPEIAWRIPLATWFRFRAACERTRVSLVLLTQHPCARSSAELVVRLQTGIMEAQNNVMTGIRYYAATERSRSQEKVVSIRKPPQPERIGEWRSEVPWAQGQ